MFEKVIDIVKEKIMGKKNRLEEIKKMLWNDNEGSLDIKYIQSVITGNFRKQFNLTSDDYLYLLDSVIKSCKEEIIPVIDDKKYEKYYIIGDLHADMVSMKNILTKINFAENYKSTKLVFLGDYVDRGADWLAVIETIVILKFFFPDNVVILRGNHESYVKHDGNYSSPMSGATTKNYFINKFSSIPQYNILMLKYIELFDAMSICSLIDSSKLKIFCVHGGIPRPDLSKVNYFGTKEENKKNALLELVEKELDCCEEKQSYNMMWSDPYDGDIENFSLDSKIRFKFTKEHFIHFCEKYDIDVLLRAHQEFTDGYKIYFDDRLISVFSTGGTDRNKNSNSNSAYAKVSPNILEIDFKEEKIISWDISFDDEPKKEESYVDFSTIVENRNKHVEKIEEFIPTKETHKYKKEMAKISYLTLTDINNKKVKRDIYFKENTEAYVNFSLIYSRFYGVRKDFYIAFDKDKNKLINKSKEAIVFNEIVLETDKEMDISAGILSYGALKIKIDLFFKKQ